MFVHKLCRVFGWLRHIIYKMKTKKKRNISEVRGQVRGEECFLSMMVGKTTDQMGKRRPLKVVS